MTGPLSTSKSSAVLGTNADANAYSSAETTDSEGGSPSPTPRPGSALSTMSMTMFSRRSTTPMYQWIFETNSQARNGLSATFHPQSGDENMTVTTASTAATTTATSSGLLKVLPTAANFESEHSETYSNDQFVGAEDTSFNIAGDNWIAKIPDDQLNRLEGCHDN